MTPPKQNSTHPVRRTMRTVIKLSLLAIAFVITSPWLVIMAALCLVGVAESHGGISPQNEH